MKKILLFLIIPLVLFHITPLVNASEFSIVGARAMGMGGAYVAIVNDATASYWNPGAFGFFGYKDSTKGVDKEYGNKKFGSNLPVDVGASVHGGLIKEVDDILKYDFNALSDKAKNGTLVTQSDINNLLNIVREIKDLSKDDLGAAINVDTGLLFRFNNYGIGILGLIDAGGVPKLDANNLGINSGSISAIDALSRSGTYTTGILTPTQRSNLESRIKVLPGWDNAKTTTYLDRTEDAILSTGLLTSGNVPSELVETIFTIANAASTIDTVTKDSTGGNFSNNNSKVTFQGAWITEVPLSYGMAINDNLAIGGNVKYMRAVTYFREIRVFSQDADNFFKDFTKDAKTSSNIGVDLGVLYRYKILRAGVVMRNINSPSFDSRSAKRFKPGFQSRAGIALKPISPLTVSFDIDLKENDTTLSDTYKSRNMAVGAEFDLLNFLAIRGGMYKNIAENDIGLVYTAGLGLNIIGFHLDVAAAMSSKSEKFDKYTIPGEVKATVSLSLQY